MSKPDWSSSPKWANWLAADEFGYWHWFEYKPWWDVNYGYWVDGGQMEAVGKLTAFDCMESQQSLEERP